MHLQATQTVDLLDRKNRRLGLVTIERVDDDFVLGSFEPSPEFAAVEPLFSELVEAANEQLFHRVDDLDSAIAQLGLHLGTANGAPLPAISDVQIADGNISFRRG